MRIGVRQGFTWLAVPFAVAALAGCGETKSKPATSAVRPQAATKAAPASPAKQGDFERAANRLCADAGAKVGALPPLAKSNFLPQVRYEQGLIRSLIARLRPLHPPPGKRRGFARFLSDTSAQPVIIDGAIAALRSRRAHEARVLLKRLAAKGESSDRAAASIGLADCARDYSPVPHPTA